MRLLGLSGQQLRRIEKGSADVTAIAPARIARATGEELNSVLCDVRTIEGEAHRIWEPRADFKAKKALLETMELWEA